MIELLTEPIHLDPRFARGSRATGFKAALPNMMSQTKQVYFWLKVNGCATQHQLAAELHMPLASINRCICKLMEAEPKIVATGQAPGLRGAMRTVYGIR